MNKYEKGALSRECIILNRVKLMSEAGNPQFKLRLKHLPTGQIFEVWGKAVMQGSFAVPGQINNIKHHELAFKAMLDQTTIEYTHQKYVKTDKGHRYIDFFIPSHNLAVEIDEGFHKSQVLLDKWRELEIKKSMDNGVKFIRIPHLELERGLATVLAEMI